jgi:hypothetical protein
MAGGVNREKNITNLANEEHDDAVYWQALPRFLCALD